MFQREWPCVNEAKKFLLKYEYIIRKYINEKMPEQDNEQDMIINIICEKIKQINYNDSIIVKCIFSLYIKNIITHVETSECFVKWLLQNAMADEAKKSNNAKVIKIQESEFKPKIKKIIKNNTFKKFNKKAIEKIKMYCKNKKFKNKISLIDSDFIVKRVIDNHENFLVFIANKMKKIDNKLTIYKKKYKKCLSCYDLCDISCNKCPRCDKCLEPGKYRTYFCKKNDMIGLNKVNVYFDDLATSLKSNNAGSYIKRVEMDYDTLSEYYDDQICIMIIFAFCIDSKFGVQNGYDISKFLMMNYEFAKDLNVMIKGIGANITEYGSMFCECGNMRGRGAIGLDKRNQALQRINNENKNIFSKDKLKHAIMRILSEELDIDQVNYENAEEWFTKRWLWSSNGGHSKVVGVENPRWSVEFKGQMHRKAALECFTDNVLQYWDGKVYVSMGEKLETDKRRMLLATDTVTYACFEYVIKPIENAWKNKRVLLNPNKQNLLEQINYYSKLCKENYNIMCDYDYMDMQHSSEALKLVYECLFELVGNKINDQSLMDRIVDSWDNMYVYEGRELVGRVNGTLVTGHRSTSFSNSILNGAYILCAIGDDNWKNTKSVHTGDDVVIWTKDRCLAYDIYNQIQNSDIQMNKTKQSMGRNCCEFLRMCIGPNFARGYPIRAIAEFVDGNWTTERELPVDERINMYISSVRTIVNRSRVMSVGDLFVRSFSKRYHMPFNVCKDVLVGNGVIEKGVPMKCEGMVKIYHNLFKRSINRDVDDNEGIKISENATVDYLENHTSELERDVLIDLGYSPKEVMVESSWMKDYYRDHFTKSVEINCKYSTEIMNLKGQDTVDSMIDKIRHKKREKNIVAKYPLILQVKKLLQKSSYELIKQTLNLSENIETIKNKIDEDNGNKVFYPIGVIPYNLSNELRRYTNSNSIKINYNIYM